jgi:opacity protein-like surface antigen
MKLRLALAAACLAVPAAAHAQAVTGPYVSLGAGTSIMYPTNYAASTGTLGATDTGKLLSRPDYAGVGALGFGFGNGLRVELGGNFTRYTATKIDSDTVGGVKAYGGINQYGPMFNALYDFSVGLPVYPYIGAGVGYQWTKLNSDVTGNLAAGGTSNGGTRPSFAYQGIAGLAYPLPMVPGLSLTAEYRFMQLTESRKFPSTTTVAGVGSFAGVTKLGQESSHTFLIGLRYQLFPAPMMAAAPAPAAAPMAAPAPAPARTYLVFFDWDKSSLTPRATQIIAQAASDSKTTAVTTLDVSGYTDTSGTPVYNQGLSERRAKAVAAQLVADGVPASEIAIHAYGQTHLLVPTGPGVREPQNRRVEIVLQ